MYGCFDLGRTPSSRQATDSTLILYKKSMNEVIQLVFPGWSIEQRQKPEYSQRICRFKKSTSALFTVGTVDPLLDDTFLWKIDGEMAAINISCDLSECPHAFNFSLQSGQGSK